MDSFGNRLKRERERLGYNQTKFAEACGVGRTAQFNYERGEREPDAVYMAAAVRLGVDVPYLLTGKSAETIERRAYIRLLDSIGERLSIDIWGGIDDVAWEEELKWAKNNPPDETGSPSLNIPNENITKAVNKVLDNALAGIALDHSLLTEVLKETETSLLKRGWVIEPAKKAKVVVMLYRAFKASGKVDHAMIEEAVTLAAG